MHNQEEPVAVRAVDHWLAAVPAEHEHFDRPADYPRDHLGRIIATSHRHDRAWQQVWSSVGRQPYGYPASAAIMEDDDEMEEDVHLTASVLLATDREEDEKGDEFLMTSPPAASLLPRSNANWGASLVALLANNNNANNNNDSHNNNNNSNHSHNDLRYYHRRPSMMASHYDARGRGYGGNETIPVDIDQSINAWYADSAANEEDYLSKEMSALFPDGTLDKQSNVTHALRPMGTLRGHVAKSRAPAPSTVHVQPQSLHPPAPASTTTGLSRKKSLSDIFAQIVAPGKPASTIQSITSGRRPASTVNRWTTSQPADDKRKGNPSGGPSKPHMYPLIGTPTVERRNSLGSLGISDVDDQRQDQLSRDDSLLRDQVRLLLSNMVDTPQGTPSLSPDTRQQHKQQKHKQNKKPPPVKIPTQHRGDSLGLRSNGDMSDILTSLFQKDDEDVLSIPASQRHDDQSILGEFHTECVLPSATSSLPTKHRKQDNNVNVATTDTVAHSPGPLLSPGQYFARHSGPLGDLEGNVDEWLRPNFFFKNKMQKENPAVITNSLTAMLSANNNRKPPVKRPSSSVKANPIWSVPSSPPPPPPLIATVAASATAPTPMAPTAVNNPQQTPVKSNDPPSKENPSLDWLYATTMKPPRAPQPNPSAVPFKLNTTKKMVQLPQLNL
ncbi:hypothetical protein BDF22DRAFT_128835 [Syncephalis plumigaleata]|nr:hypothetical protein BDF22DRAFT_128835 [Syncephalis plumigaleata]